MINFSTGKRKKKAIFWLKIILIFYCTIGVTLYFIQEKFLFHPVALAENYVFNFNTPFEEITVPYNSTTTFHIVKFKPAVDVLKKGAVIYCHGNMENISRYAPLAANFTQHGYEVWMMDYPGFGKSTGALSEEMMYKEVLEVYKITCAVGYTPDSIIIYGKSLGTGIAAQLASIRDCKRLILEAPYYSIENVAARYFWMYPVDWMVHYKIPTFQYLQKVTAPVTIFHGTNDDTISFSNSEKLKAFLKKNDELIPVTGGHHNDLNDFPIMKLKLDSLLSL